jgi:flagellar biosynthesis/type III secretory pathway protein FliH
MIKRVAADTVMESSLRRAVAGGMAVPAAFAAEPVDSVDDIDAAAYRKGYGEGFEAGEHDGLREIEQRKIELEAQADQALQNKLAVLTEKEQRLDALVQGVEEALRRHEQGMRELAFELALRSLGQLFTASENDRTLLARLCERMADEHRGEAMQMAVSPDDRALLPERIGGFDVVEMTALPAGACRIVGEHGDTESSIAIRLTAIHESMLGALGVSR